MLGHVSHTRVLEAVLADPGANETSNWSELRRLLGEIIDTFRWHFFQSLLNLDGENLMARYESQLLESSRQVVHEERAALVSSPYFLWWMKKFIQFWVKSSPK